jgi:putative peptidoglycan lipid II flippase
MLGGVLQLAAQVPALLRIGAMPRFGLRPSAVRAAAAHPGVGRVLRQMAPALLGVSVAQISVLINTQIATQVGPGAVSWLGYADRLMEFPTGLLGVAIGVVLLPQLSASRTAGDSARYSALLDWGLRLVFLQALPCAVALIVFPQALVAVLYHRGAFSATDVAQTVAPLMGYGVGLMGLIALKVVAPGYYARQDLRTPVKVAVAVLVLTQLMNLAFVPWFGHAGLALSIGCGALVNTGWLLFGLHRAGTWRPEPGWPAFAAKVVASSALMGAGLAWAGRQVDWIALGAHEGQRALTLAAVIVVAALVYFGTLRLMGLRPRDFVRRG